MEEQEEYTGAADATTVNTNESYTLQYQYVDTAGQLHLQVIPLTPVPCTGIDALILTGAFDTVDQDQEQQQQEEQEGAVEGMTLVPPFPTTMIGPAALKRTLQLFCVDLSGTIHIGNELLPGTKEALFTLADRQYNVKFVTNTTKESKAKVIQRLAGVGLDVQSSDIYSSLSITRDYILRKKLRPLFLVDDNAMEEFSDIDTTNPNSVVIGLAPKKLNYEHLNEAFRTLCNAGSEAHIVATHKGRFYNDGSDGPCNLSLGPGPFVSALEYATGLKASVLGKPNIMFFDNVINDCGCRPQTTIMIGDDVRDDVIGALQAGMNACLVKTGKYQPGDEDTEFLPPGEVVPVPVHTRALVVDSFAEAVRLLT